MTEKQAHSNEAPMQTEAPRPAAPGTPANLPLHEVTIRFERDHGFRCNPATGALERYEERTAFAYFQGVHKGHRVYRLADADGEPLERVWAATEEEIVRDVPADVQPAQVPAAVERERESFTKEAT